MIRGTLAILCPHPSCLAVNGIRMWPHRHDAATRVNLKTSFLTDRYLLKPRSAYILNIFVYDKI